MNRSIKVRVTKKSPKSVTVHFVSLNRSMPVPRKEFEERVEKGLYQVIGSETK